jgi:hypothetical protein
LARSERRLRRHRWLVARQQHPDGQGEPGAHPHDARHGEPVSRVSTGSGGRWISEDEDKPGGAPVAVLSYGFWQERFAGDPNVVGQTITLDGILREL